ncbi:MAG: type II toxin-antitoxin system HicB family antitoxin [Candidatus Zambryskibacteria bacterium]|nr:type II toxin-antitoxin system HicB family antitoxin [Candidatus Zambryskibacteria bacterium]
MKNIKGKKEKHFTAFFEKNELRGYTVTVPSLPGLVTEGRTFEEAKIMAYDAVKCYIQGLKKTKKDVRENETGSFQIAVAI